MVQFLHSEIVTTGISIGDVPVKEEGGVLRGAYSLKGGLGQQDNIHVAIIGVSSNDNTIVDISRLPQKFSLQVGQVVSSNFSYTLPTHLQGEVTFYLQVVTEGGASIGVRPLIKKNFPATPSKNLICKIIEDSASVDCLLSKKGDIIFSISKNTPANIPFIIETKHSDVANKHILLQENLPSGEYYVDATVSGSDEHVYLPLTIVGEYGSITGTFVHKKSDGVVMVSVATFSSSKDSLTARTMLTDTAGKHCGTGSKIINASTSVADIEIQSSCKEGVSRFELIDAKGKMIDMTTEHFSLVPFKSSSDAAVNQNDTEQSESPAAPQVGTIILVIGAVVVSFYMYKKRNILT